MDGIVLVFTDEATALAARRQIWINVVKDQVAAGVLAKDGEGQFYDNLQGLSDDQIAALRLCGVKEGDFRRDNGTTISYGDATKAYDLQKWYMQKPPVEYLFNVMGYVEENFDPEWIPPEYRVRP